MLQNLHAHTERCGHAQGSEEQYVLSAIEGGLQVMGFSDHSPYAFPASYRSKVRMGMEQLPDYVQTVRALGKKYANSIRIHVGVEAEYYPAYFESTRQQLADGGIEYMILGQHWVDNEIDAYRTSHPTEDESLLRKYCHQVLDAMQTGYFTYLCHPDVMNFVGNPRLYDRYMRQLCREANSCNMAIEYNLWGIYHKKFYPIENFWHIAAEENCTVVLGIDAHCPEVLEDRKLFAQGAQFIQGLGMQILDSCPLRKIY